ALDAVNHRLGRREGRGPVLDELRARVPVTFAIVSLAILLAYAAAVPLGALSAARRGRRVDLTIACTLLGLYAIPTAVIAVIIRALPGGEQGHLLYAVLALALGLT